MSITRDQFHRRIQKRIQQLAIPNSELAKRSRLDCATVERVLSTPISVPFEQLVSVGASIGLNFKGASRPVRNVLRTAVLMKARYLVRLVQGTAALESQAVDQNARRELTKLAIRELSADRKRIWQ